MAVQSPKVETLAQSMAGLDPAFQEQKGLIQEQIGGLDAKYDIEKQAMEGTRVQSFESINRSMVGRGAAFSGIGADEQSRYLANEYLPGLQRVDQAKRDESLKLRGQVADLGMQQTTMAMSRIQQQEQALNQWNLQQAQMEAQAREAEIQRQFQANQNALDRQQQASIAAANRAASAAASAPRGLTTADASGILSGLVAGKQGKDGKISPSTYRALVSDAYEKGIDPASYATLMQRYVNQSHYQDYVLN